MDFQTMPLRFRVWDKETQELHTDLDFWQVAHLTHQKGEFNGRFIVSQDTGLKDRNGDSIFTGDVIKLVDTGADGFTGDGDLGAVAFQDGELLLVDEEGMYKYRLPFLDPDALCKIGNIWENPELLEK